MLAPATCLPCHWDISPEIAARLSERAGRQRAMTADDQILLVLFHAPQPRQRERHPAYFLRGSDGAWQTPDREDGLETLRQLIDEYDQQLARLEEEQDSASSIAEWFKILSEVGPLFRATRNMYDALQSARQSISDPLRRQELQRPCDRASDAMRAAELLQMDAHNSVQFSLAQQAEIQAELSQQQTTASHRLNILAAVFLPLATIASVFGMNVANGFESTSTWLFWAIFMGGISFGAIASAVLVNLPKKQEEA